MAPSTLLIGHGSAHAIDRHHLFRPSSRGGCAFHTMDIDAGCRPTFVADASARALPRGPVKRRAYDKVVTMHLPCAVWLEQPASPGRAGRWRLCQQFFRNVHGWLREGGELHLELPMTALSLMSRRTILGDYTKSRDALRSAKYSGSILRASEETASKVSAFAAAPGSGRKLFDVSRVGRGWCVLAKA